MLFVLTGQIQTGKTRWLGQLLDDLSRKGVTPYGVLAPGVWADRRDDTVACPHADANGFEKLGIDNVLLPGGERIAFARRSDLAKCDGEFDPNSQSAQAKLGWAIDDNAIERVNSHFSSLRALAHKGAASPGIVVIDELGRLELERGEGLTEAVALLQDGPSPLARHALIVVREALVPHVENRFQSWGETAFVHPDAESREFIMRTVARNR